VTDIYILGTGQRFPGHITLELLEALDECQRVFTLLTAEEIAKLPVGIGGKCVSMWPHYHPDRPRNDNYAEVSAAILEAAQAATPVGWLTLGNPRILDSVSETLVTMGPEKGLSVTSLPAVSSIDSVLVDVDYDPASGLLVVEATTALIRQTPLIPEVATLVFQPGVFGTFYPRLTEDDRPVDLSKLRDYLLRYYPSDHSLAFVSSSASRDLAPMLAWTTIGQLAAVKPVALQRSTMFIPPARTPMIDHEYVATVERSA
jgi:uncharacterized protein YabN with tetrapyrrole methylase and pyrophosphatase domain